MGYKVFYQKDGKLYPPMVANPGGADTPVGVWLDADEGVRAGTSKTGRPQVKAGGKGTQGGSGTLAYRPGWHLGTIPYALQFNRKNPVTGERDLFPADFVWAEVEYAADENYQEEAMKHGLNKNGRFRHSLAGLPRIPEDGYYEYRANPDPRTDPWIITGAMKVNHVLSKAEVDEMVRAAGREPQQVQGGVTFSTYTTRVLHRAYATDVNGNKLGADAFITTPNGNLNWYEFPKDDKTQRLLASRGIKSLPIRLRIGRQNKSAHSGYGLIHLLNHYDDYSKIGETPLLHLFNTLANLVKIRGGAFGRYDFKGEYGGKDSKLVAQLVEEDGCYSIVSCYPVQMNRRPQAGELVIGRVLFQFPTNSETAQVLGGKTQGDAVTASAGTNGQASEEKVTQSLAQVNIYDVQIRDSSGKVIFQQPVESGVELDSGAMAGGASAVIQNLVW